MFWTSPEEQRNPRQVIPPPSYTVVHTHEHRNRHDASLLHGQEAQVPLRAVEGGAEATERRQRALVEVALAPAPRRGPHSQEGETR